MRILGFRDLTMPDAEPVSLAEAKAQLRVVGFDEDENVSDHPDDDLISSLIVAAREHAETFTGQFFARRQVLCIADEFPDCRGQININTGPVYSVEGVSYFDAGVLTEMALSDLYIETQAVPAAIALPPSASWPIADARRGALRIVIDCGYIPEPQSGFEEGRVIPASAKQAILLFMSHLYENREAVTDKPFALLPLGLQSLLRPHRIRLGV